MLHRCVVRLFPNEWRSRTAMHDADRCSVSSNCIPDPPVLPASRAGIAYVAYSTLGGQWAHRPSSSSSPNPVSADPTLGAIASAHGTSVHTVALSWALQSGAIILPRSSNSERIGANLRTFVKGIDGTSSSIKDDDAKGSADDGGGGADQACRVGESKHGAAVHVFLTDEDVDAINRLDGTIGR